MNTKICSKCKKELPATEEFFNKNSHSKDKLRAKCRKCSCKNKEKFDLMEENKQLILEGKKRCSKCKEIFPMLPEYFAVDKRNPNGLHSHCKKCKSESDRTSWKKCSKTPERKAKRKLWINNNKKRMRALHKKSLANRTQNNPQFVVISRLRSRLKNAFLRFSKNGKVKSSREYGIDYEAIFKHIGPCPGIRKDYHIDHIIPLCFFDFDDPEQVKKAFAPENHQWLLKIDNLIKGNKLPPK